jgi:hypothetical protein
VWGPVCRIPVSARGILVAAWTWPIPEFFEACGQRWGNPRREGASMILEPVVFKGAVYEFVSRVNDEPR